MKEVILPLIEAISQNGGLVILAAVAVAYGIYSMHRQQKDHADNKKELRDLRERFDQYQNVDRKRTDDLMEKNNEALKELKNAIQELKFESKIFREFWVAGQQAHSAMFADKKG